jgi:FAD synthetase
MKKILCFGTFDGLHPGHISFLRQARKYGDYLVVVIARDKNVKKLKGKYPVQNELERFKNIKKNSLVDEAILGKEEIDYDIIKEINPDVICLGYDQKVDEKKIKKLYNKKIIRLLPYKEDIYKSSKINRN